MINLEAQELTLWPPGISAPNIDVFDEDGLTLVAC